MMKTDYQFHKCNGLSSMMTLCTIVASSLVLSSCKTTTNLTTKQERSIVVLYENDVHCAIDGYAHLAALRDAVADTAHVAVVSNGDFLQGASAGAISKGGYIMNIMNTVGYDAVTLGNHEFDYKTPRLLQLIDSLKAPVTCINLYDTKTGERVCLPSVVKRYGNRSIGFVGVVTPTTIQTEKYAFFDDNGTQIYELKPDEINNLVQQAVDNLRRQNADYVIVLSHMGEADNEMHINSHTLIANTTGIDALLDGHTHSTIPQEWVTNRTGQQVLVSQTGTKFVNIGKLVISPEGKMSTTLIPVADITATNPHVEATTDSIKQLLSQITSRPICQSDVELRILDSQGRQMVRYAETNAGDLVADAYRIVTGADIALSNGGGIRTNLKAGILTYGDIISLLPFENFICTVEITGKQLTQLLTACTQYTPAENGDFPQVSGMKFNVHTATRTISDLRILNTTTNQYEPVNPDRTYSLATIDYCITGGGFFGLLKDNRILRSNISAYSQILVDYITQHLDRHITTDYAQPQGRITIME